MLIKDLLKLNKIKGWPDENKIKSYSSHHINGYCEAMVACEQADIDLPLKLCGYCKGAGKRFDPSAGDSVCGECSRCQGRGVVLDVDVEKLAEVINLWIGDLFVKSPEGKKLWFCIEDSDRTSITEAIAARINECMKEGE